MYELTIEPLTNYHDRTSFSCGVPELDRYLKEMASQNKKRKTTCVFVAAQDKQIIGYYTLSAAEVLRESLPDKIANKLPKYPIPATLLGRLATGSAFQGKQVGKALLINAMKRALLASSTIGAYALLVDAKDEKAKSFYKHFGFIALKDKPNHLFIPMKTVHTLHMS